ncbi:hypothetical protein GCK32_017317 [Trichostrongylus colubriformis]|uniref:Uncharacterized protein n=1 Tax=Trichostrongylus colubriformis TaxID=6319 RepID=A0AAN8F1K0_TRICO
MQCVRIRDNERRKLQRKVAFLRSQVHANNHHFISPNATPPKRCIVIGTDAIDEEVEALLNLGPSFAVSTAVTQEVMNTVLCAFHKFAYQIRWKESSNPTDLDRLPSFIASIPFPGTSVSAPKPVTAMEPTLASLQMELVQTYANKSSAKFASNLTQQERQGLKKLLLLKNSL